MKKIVSACTALLGLGFGGAAVAADGLITFNGYVSDKTCTIGQGSGDKVVDLDPISLSALKDGGTAGHTRFTLEFTGCSATQVKAQFERNSPQIDPATGDLKNVGSSNVQVRIFNADMERIDLRTNSNNDEWVSTTGTGGKSTATLSYYAAYQAPATGATQGNVNTYVEYSMNYQ
ncbi:fimbrial protein [Metapseudomonas furukawaii]|jgi:major type 1 subunit fimbrin (pilin)|uniref:Fimbrial protein n=1 Tax=Metapseudomonas furukawaii TaxID=1149133 RepID=A0AAD1FDK2_METFU|nr:fimbrial protein [Pseudomonas furukawaii]ELS28017.1 Fimbrial protein [Pseudomonas furukawaii]WAG79495.1 type 1 fimbrial protein [Pseudomonas furukawaii]BAU72072.1 fimbrial protein precursor [Pseudomonas furukawaii]